jgi:hypothetical protein
MGTICHVCSVQAMFKPHPCALQHFKANWCNNRVSSVFHIFLISHWNFVDTDCHVFLSAKLQCVISGDTVGQETGPARPSSRSGKCWLKDTHTEWSCCGEMHSLGERKRPAVILTLGAQNLLAFVSNWWMSRLLRHRKRARTNYPAAYHATH